MSIRFTQAFCFRLGLCLAFILLGRSSAVATILSATVTADDDYDAYIALSDSETGTLFLKNVGIWNSPESGQVELTAGVVNYLHIVARDLFGPPSSLIGTFTLSDTDFVFPNGSQTISTNPVHWKMGRVGFGSGYEPITDIGPNGNSPWGTMAGIAANARYIWTQFTAGEHYFSIAIIPSDATGNYRYLLDPDSSETGDEVEQTSPIPVSHTYLEGGRKALLSADPGRIGVHIQEDVNVSGTGGSSENTILAETEFLADDFVVTTNTNLRKAVVSLNMSVKGIIVGGAGSSTSTDESSSSRGIVDIWIRVNESEVFTGNAEVTASHTIGRADPGTSLSSNSTGMLEGIFPQDVSDPQGTYASSFSIPLDTIIQTDPFEVEVGVPNKVEVRLTARTITSTSNGTASARVDLSGGVTFPENFPVMTLPEGFTVTSPTANILENTFEPKKPPVVFLDGIFLQIPPIEGESTAEGHENWIDLNSISTSVYQAVSSIASFTQRRGTAVLRDTWVRKDIDKSSPKLIEAVLDGRIFPEAAIEVNRPLADGRQVYLNYRMQDVMVTSVEVDDDPSNPAIEEFVAFNYGYANWDYREFSLDGRLKSETSLWWNIEAGKGGLSSTTGDNQPPTIRPVDAQVFDPGSLVNLDLFIDDADSSPENLSVEVSTSRPDMISDLSLTGTGSSRTLTFRTSALLSQSAVVSVRVADAFDVRSISFLVTGSEPTPYEAFLSAYFSDEELQNDALSSPLQDPDFDNLPTIIEYLLGTNPLEFNYESEAFLVTEFEEAGVRKIRVEFLRRINDPNVSGDFWGSSDMNSWAILDTANPLYEEQVLPSSDPSFEEVTATITYPDGTDSYFIRFHVLNQN